MALVRVNERSSVGLFDGGNPPKSLLIGEGCELVQNSRELCWREKRSRGDLEGVRKCLRPRDRAGIALCREFFLHIKLSTQLEDGSPYAGFDRRN